MVALADSCDFTERWAVSSHSHTEVGTAIRPLCRGLVGSLSRSQCPGLQPRTVEVSSVTKLPDRASRG